MIDELLFDAAELEIVQEGFVFFGIQVSLRFKGIAQMLEELILVLRFVRHRLRHGDIENEGNRTERSQNHQRTRIGYQASVVLGPTLT